MTLAFNGSVGGANGLYVGPLANATSHSTMFHNGATDCDVSGGWTIDTSMDDSATCPGALAAPAPPVSGCVVTGDHQSHCPTLEGQGIATCYAPDDQLSSLRHPTDCWIGAYEAA